jgi:hypothetical protein
MICGVLGRAGQLGKEARLEAAKQQNITYAAPENLSMPAKRGTKKNVSKSPDE